MASLTFRVNAACDLPIDSLVKTIRLVSEMVKSIDYAASGGKTPRSWFVERLASSAPTITLRSPTPGGVAVPILLSGLHVVAQAAENPEPPRYFTDDAFRVLKRLGGELRPQKPADSIAFFSPEAPDRTEEIDDRVILRVDRIIRSGYYGWGAIEGHLGAISTHRRRQFTVWDEVTGVPVTCVIPSGVGWLERVKNALDSRAAVRGRVRYFPNGIPRAIDEVDEIGDLTPDPALPSAYFGSIPGITSGEDAVTYVKSRR